MRTFLTIFSLALIAAGIQNDDAKSACAGVIILFLLYKKHKIKALMTRN